MKRLLILTMFLMSGTWSFSQDKLGFGNMPDGGDSAGFGLVTTWVKPTQDATCAMTTTAQTVTLGLANTSNITINWGDGSDTIAVGEFMEYSHTYSISGSKNISLQGGLASLTYLYCSSNQLTSLDVSVLSSLIGLDCSSNQLTSLGVSGLTSLIGLFCSSNQLNSVELTNIVDQLLVNDNAGIYAYLSSNQGCVTQSKFDDINAFWDEVYVDICP